MVKRKSRRPKPAPKAQPKLEVEFTCPFCNHQNSVCCTLDMKLKIGEAKCWECKESYATTIHHLTEPIDIYTEWLDRCEEVNDQRDEHRRPSKRTAVSCALEDHDDFLN